MKSPLVKGLKNGRLISWANESCLFMNVMSWLPLSIFSLSKIGESRGVGRAKRVSKKTPLVRELETARFAMQSQAVKLH